MLGLVRATFFLVDVFGLLTEVRLLTAFFLAIGIFQDVSLVSVSQKINRSQITRLPWLCLVAYCQFHNWITIP